jgi:hypothetical protein
VLTVRRMSGRIETSEASELWKESASIRDDYRTRLLQANERATSVEIRMAAVEQQNNALVQENFALRHKVEELEALVKAQAETIRSLEALVQSQREEIEGGG